MYSGRYVDPVSGKTVKQKGEVANTVKVLVLETYSGKGHVLYTWIAFSQAGHSLRSCRNAEFTWSEQLNEMQQAFQKS